MNYQLILFFFITFILNSCAIDKEVESISEKVSNVSDKVINLVQTEEVEKPSKKDKFKNITESINHKKEKITYKFFEWKCVTFFSSSHVLNVGYFPDSKKNNVSAGALTLETNNEIYTSLHEIEGIEDVFSWGGKKLNKFKLIIKPNNTAYYYDFKNAKKGEKIKSKQTLRCHKNSFDLNKVEFIKYWRSIKKDVEKIGITIDLN